MTPSPTVRRVLLAVALVVLLCLAWLGISGGLHQIPQSHTPGQIAQTASQLAYGIFALLSAATTFWGRAWSRVVLICWLASVTLAAGLASVVWGGTSLVVGLLSGLAAFLVALAITWLLRVGARGLTGAWTSRTDTLRRKSLD